jgi:hypothetical protein
MALLICCWIGSSGLFHSGAITGRRASQLLSMLLQISQVSQDVRCVHTH